MCMIAYRPLHAKSGKGSNIPGSVIDTALRRHPDGFGLAYRENGELVTEKFGPHEAKRFRKALKRVDREVPSEYVAHWRFATHGPKDQAHAHPYEYTHPVDGRVLVFHNGVIDIATTPAQSDTEVFTGLVLAELPSRWWENPALMFLVTEAIGWSKLVIMTATGTYNLHEKRGSWDGGIWYSSSHKPSTTTYRGPAMNYPSYGSYKSGATSVASTAGVTSRDAVIKSTSSAYTAKDFSSAGDGKTFFHGGHALSAVVDIDRLKDGDYTDGVMCDTCWTMGDVYVIDGGVYIDMAHKGDTSPREEEDMEVCLA